MCLGVFFNKRDAVVLAAGEFEIVQRDAIDWEKAAGGTIFRCHVGDGGAVGQSECRQAGAEELDELVDHTLLAQHLRHQQHKVGCGHTFFQFARHLETNDFRQQHGLRLAEHGGLSFDATDTPTQNAQAVDHGCVRVGADKCVRIGDGDLGLCLALHNCFSFRPHGLTEVLKIDLVANAGAGGNDAEVFKGTLPPFQELVALQVLLIFTLHVGSQRL